MSLQQKPGMELRKRQISIGIGGGEGNGGGNGQGNNGNGQGNGGSDLTTTTTTTTTTTASPTPTSTTASSTTTSTTSSPTPTPTTSSTTTTTTTTTRPETTTVIVTPTTVIVVGTSTITSVLPPVTSTGLVSPTAGANRGTAGLSTGAKAGIIAGSVVGGLAILAALVILCCVARRRKRRKEDDAIRWPEIQDQAALYPQPVHSTGGAGVGGDEMEEVGDHHHAGYGAAAAGAGIAGAGAFGAARYNSMSSSGGRQPTLPTVPPSIYSSEESPYSSYGVPTPYSPAHTSHYGGGSSQNSAAALAPGPASIEYQRAMAANGSDMRHNTPSPPRQYNGDATSSAGEHGAGALPLPGSEMGHEEFDRPASPTDMQVGDSFGHGYDEADGGRRWRLSVVNDDPRGERGY